MRSSDSQQIGPVRETRLAEVLNLCEQASERILAFGFAAAAAPETPDGDRTFVLLLADHASDHARAGRVDQAQMLLGQIESLADVRYEPPPATPATLPPPVVGVARHRVARPRERRAGRRRTSSRAGPSDSSDPDDPEPHSPLTAGAAA